MSNLLSANELAEKLGVTRQTIYQLRARHSLPYVKIGTTVRFDESQIDAWIKKNTVGAIND